MTVRVGVLGAGTVGGALINRLVADRDAIRLKSGVDLEVRKVAVRDLAKERPFTLSEDRMTDDPFAVVTDPAVDVIVEVIGGLEPAGDLVLAALKSGKPVVTANKELIATRGQEITEAAKRAGVSIMYEAAVGGGIPVIRPLAESLAGEDIDVVSGIVNGTTNYILTAMAKEGRAYEDALAEAQRLGYAEADPGDDVSGRDAAFKTSILASLAFGERVAPWEVECEGIENVTAEEVQQMLCISREKLQRLVCQRFHSDPRAQHLRKYKSLEARWEVKEHRQEILRLYNEAISLGLDNRRAVAKHMGLHPDQLLKFGRYFRIDLPRGKQGRAPGSLANLKRGKRGGQNEN